MPDFAWIIQVEKPSLLGQRGISPSYIVPHRQMNSHEKSLGGNLIWMIMRTHEDRCIGVLGVKQIERFSEGYHSGDFLITCDSASSVRLSSAFDRAKPYLVENLQELGPGIHEIPAETTRRIRSSISNSIPVRLTVPPESMLRNIELEHVSKGSVSLLKTALSRIAREFSLDQIWASGAGAKLGPYANFAQSLLDVKGYGALNAEAVAFLKEADPLSALLKQRAGNKNAEPGTTGRSVDLDFTEIDPANVYAREFIYHGDVSLDLENAIRKTETAEKLHQSMLRDISAYLKKNSITPFESGSVDLMIEHSGKTRIFEIKSATNSNIMAQAAKGAFQIACYVNAMSGSHHPLCAAIIIHKIEDESLEQLTREALEILGVTYLVYDPGNEWPHRVEHLLNNGSSYS